MGYSSIIGAAMDIAGTAINANEADARKAAQEKIANTPGIDFNALTAGALGGYNQNFDAAQSLSSRLSSANQAQLNAQQEQAMPGIGAARGAALGRVSDLFASGDAFKRRVQQLGGIAGVGSGLFGSGAGQLQSVYQGYNQQNQDTALGVGLLGSLISGLRLANTPGVQSFLGPSISEQLATRSNECTQKLSMLTGANNLPSGLETWGTRLQQVGGTMEGVGAGGGSMYGIPSNFGGFGGGFGGGGGGIAGGPGGAVGGWGGT